MAPNKPPGWKFHYLIFFLGVISMILWKRQKFLNSLTFLMANYCLKVHNVLFKLAHANFRKRFIFDSWYIIQECIPVGCVPPAAVAIGGGGLHQAPPRIEATPRRKHLPPGLKHTPWEEAHPPKRKHPPRMEAPPGRRHLGGSTPPRRKHPPWEQNDKQV